MRSQKAAEWTIHYSGLHNEDPEDSDFPSDEESDSSGFSSDSPSITSGDNEILTEACTAKNKKACEAKKAQEAKACRAKGSREAMQVRAANEAHAAKERQARVAKEREAHATYEQEARAAEEDPAAEESEEMQDILLTDQQVSILLRRLPEFRQAHPDTRTTIIQNVVSELERSWSHETDFDRDLVKTIARRFLYNRCRRDRKTPNFHRNWTYKEIVIDVHRKELNKMAAELSGSKPGSVAYIACYGKALKVIEEGLDEETRIKYRAEAKQWSEHKPPPRQQQRMFEKHGISTLREFSEMMYRQYGVRVAVLAGYCDAEGESAIMLYDNNDKLDGTSFKDRNKQWPKDPLVKDFSKWTAESFGVNLNDSGQENRKKMDAVANIKLTRDSRGYPMLPSWEAINREGHSYKKALIGRFLGELYQTATGGKGRIPWARLQEAQGDFILPEYLPNGIMLTQYHHIRLEDANTLLQHWTQRQASGEIPFRFKNNPKVDRGGKRASAGDNVPIPAAPINQLDGDHQGTGSRQEQGSNEVDQGDGEEVSGNCQLDHRASSRSGVQDTETSKELPQMQGGEGDLASHPPNPPRLRLRPRRFNLVQQSIADQAAEPSTDCMPHNSTSTPGTPAQGHSHNDETAADDAQETSRKRKNTSIAAGTRPPKRRNIENGQGDVQPEPRRSTRPPRPAEWVKNGQGDVQPEPRRSTRPPRPAEWVKETRMSKGKRPQR